VKVYYTGDLSDWMTVQFYDEEGTVLHVYAAQITIAVEIPTIVELDFGKNADPNARFRRAELIAKPITSCPECKGTGEYVGFTRVTACNRCEGKGHV
jgi:uncharacterized paraquat-inducible protein A